VQAPRRPPITFSFHDRQTIQPATLKRIPLAGRRE
jgi:hypothetical protein